MDSYSVSECKWDVFMLLSIYYTFIGVFFCLFSKIYVDILDFFWKCNAIKLLITLQFPKKIKVQIVLKIIIILLSMDFKNTTLLINS